MSVSIQQQIPTFYGPKGGSSIYNQEVTKFLSDAENVSNRILGKKIATPRPTPAPQPQRVVNHVHVGSPYPGVYVNTGHHYHHGGYNGGRRGEVSTGLRWAAGIAATAAGGIALYKLGSTISRGEETQEEIERLRSFRSKLKHYKTQYTNNDHLKKIDKVAKARESILQRTKRSSFVNLVLTVGVAVSAILGLAGALAASAPLLIAAVCVGATALGGAAIKWGFESTSKRNKADAEIISSHVSALKKATQRIPHTITVQQGTPAESAQPTGQASPLAQPMVHQHDQYPQQGEPGYYPSSEQYRTSCQQY